MIGVSGSLLRLRRSTERGLRRRNGEAGIALGPILFIIAILAILAAAIAAGVGGFVANTGTESDKAMAETLITLCDDYQRAVQWMVMNNGCEVTALDFTPPSVPAGSTWTQGDWTLGNGTNRAGNGQCALFDPRGGLMIFGRLPNAALATPTTGAYSNMNGNGGAGPQVDIWAGYPIFDTSYCINGTGTCSLGGG